MEGIQHLRTKYEGTTGYSQSAPAPFREALYIRQMKKGGLLLLLLGIPAICFADPSFGPTPALLLLLAMQLVFFVVSSIYILHKLYNRIYYDKPKDRPVLTVLTFCCIMFQAFVIIKFGMRDWTFYWFIVCLWCLIASIGIARDIIKAFKR
jgi:hypothetical protein